LESIDTILKHGKNLKAIADTHQNSLFGGMTMPLSTIQLSPAIPATKKMKLSWEKELLGLYVSDHPVTEYQAYFDKATVPLHELEKRADNSRVRIGGVITDVRKILTKNQNTMYFIGLEDMTGRVELLVFGKTALRTGESWIEDEIVIVDARISHKDGTFRCIAESVERVSQNTVHQFARAEATRTKNSQPETLPEEKAEKFTVITIKNDAPGKIIEHLSQLLKTIPAGPEKIAVHIQGATIETTFSLALTEEHLGQIKALEGIESVE
jgi:DNA polymerase-3 subunit alpha